MPPWPVWPTDPRRWSHRHSPCPVGLPPAAGLVSPIRLTHSRARGTCTPSLRGQGPPWQGRAEPSSPQNVPDMALLKISWAGLPPCANRQHPLTKPSMGRDFFLHPKIFSDRHGDIHPGPQFPDEPHRAQHPAEGREGASQSLPAAQPWSTYPCRAQPCHPAAVSSGNW